MKQEELLSLIVGPNESDNEKFGKILHDFRNNIRLSRSEAANRLGISSEYIRLMERGIRTPALGTAIKLLDIYEIPYDINQSRVIFENTAVKFTSRIKEARHKRLPDLSRNEMIGEIINLLVIADDDTLKKILASFSRSWSNERSSHT
jgi:transcriptional regulator with XRE-family HTH domain